MELSSVEAEVVAKVLVYHHFLKKIMETPVALGALVVLVYTPQFLSL